MIESIRASPDFPLIVAFFIAVVIGLVVFTINVINNIKSRKMMEKFLTYDQGEDAMKGMFEAALDGVVPTGTTGNQQKQVTDMRGIMQALSHQSTGMVQRMRQLTLQQAASAELASGQQILNEVDQHITAASGQFQQDVPNYTADALGGPPPVQETIASSAPAPAETESVSDSAVAVASEPVVVVETVVVEPVAVASGITEEFREVIRNIPPLKICLEEHGIDPKTSFDIISPDCLVPKLIEKLSFRDGMKREQAEIDLYSFLREMIAHRTGRNEGIQKTTVVTVVFFCIIF